MIYVSSDLYKLGGSLKPVCHELTRERLNILDFFTVMENDRAGKTGKGGNALETCVLKRTDRWSLAKRL